MMTVQETISLVRGSAYLLVPRMPLFGVDYERPQMVRDLIAGTTVAAVLIPQSMAYALLAGIPPAHGLYAALIGGIAGALWSRSPYLATGPIAVTSLLTLTAVAPFAQPGSTLFIALVAALAVVVGLIQIGAGLFRLGFLVRLVPQSVLTGFTSGAALVIILTQIPHLLGVSVASSSIALEYLRDIVLAVPQLNLFALALGALALVALLIARKLIPRFPSTLLVLILGIAGTYAFDLAEFGVVLAGSIPARLPITDFPALSFGTLAQLGGQALVIAFVGFMSSYAVLKDMAEKEKERVHTDQELIAQGCANLFAGFFRGCPVGGSISRSAVNYAAGAATAWSGVFASLFVIVAILFLSPILSLLPNAVLAAIVITAVVPLVNFSQLRRLYEITHTDGVIALATFCAVFLVRPDEALLLGVILALALYMHAIMWTKVTEVGIHPRWGTVHIRESFPEVATYPGTLMLRIDAPLFYANAERLLEEVIAHLDEREREEGKPMQRLVLDCSGINHVDATGVSGCAELMRDIRARGTRVYVMQIKFPVRQILDKGGALAHVMTLHNVRELQALLEVPEERAGHVLIA